MQLKLLKFIPGFSTNLVASRGFLSSRCRASRYGFRSCHVVWRSLRNRWWHGWWWRVHVPLWMVLCSMPLLDRVVWACTKSSTHPPHALEVIGVLPERAALAKLERQAATERHPLMALLGCWVLASSHRPHLMLGASRISRLCRGRVHLGTKPYHPAQYIYGQPILVSQAAWRWEKWLVWTWLFFLKIGARLSLMCWLGLHLAPPRGLGRSDGCGGCR